MRKIGKTGVGTSSIEYSPQRIKRMKKAKVRQEKRWKEKCGPVTIKFVDPTLLKK